MFVKIKLLKYSRAPLFCMLVSFATGQSLAQQIRTDTFGGFSGIKGKATGYFHIENFQGRQLLVSPEGSGFFALGVNHINSADASGVVLSNRNDSSKTKAVLENLSRWNMNNCGYGCPDYLQDQLPFMVSIRFVPNGNYLPPKNFGFVDVFDAKFMDYCEQKIKTEAERYRDNPFLIGYYWTDTPRWDIQISKNKHGTDWVSFIKNLPADSAGKQRFVQFLQSRYETINDFNKAYSVYFTSFEALLNARFDHLDAEYPVIRKDNDLFLGVIAEHLYSTLYNQMKRYDSNHLIFGDKYLMGDHPETVLKAASKYVDVISIQPGPTKGQGPGQGDDELYFNEGVIDEIHQLSGKPVIICDHQTSFYTAEYPVTLWHQLAKEEDSVEAHHTFLKKCVERNYIIGYQRCQYISSYDTSRGLLKQGLLKENGEAYETFVSGLAVNNKSLMEFLFKKLKQ